MTSAKFSDFFYPLPILVRKFTQPPLLRLLTMSAFEGTPLPPQCGRHKWKPPKVKKKIVADKKLRESDDLFLKTF